MMKDPSEFQLQPLDLIAKKPLAVAPWQELAERVARHQDPVSIKTLAIIIEGLTALEELMIQRDGQNMPPLRIKPISKTLFTRLARSYNNPTLLKDVGLIYLRDFALPRVALRHFERAMQLGASANDLLPLCEAALASSEMQVAQRTNQDAGEPGVDEAKHAKPVAASIIKKTGKLLMASSLHRESVPLPTQEAPETEPEEPLPATTAECLKEAELAIKEGRFKRAEALLRKSDDEPAEPLVMWQAWTNLGFACYHENLSALVETAFIEALRYDHDNLASHFNAGLGYYLNGKYELALTAYKKANQLDPEDPKIWCNLGVLQFQMDDFGHAESAFRQAIAADSGYARAWDNLGAAFGAQNKLDDAVRACRQALKLRPAYPEANFKIGVIYFNQGDLPRAADEFKLAAALPSLKLYCESFQALIDDQLGTEGEAEEPDALTVA